MDTSPYRIPDRQSPPQRPPDAAGLAVAFLFVLVLLLVAYARRGAP
jgi:hypothetical protein